MTIVMLGIDLGKTVCSLVGLDGAGTVVLRRRIKRDGLLSFTAGLAPCRIAMEACCGAHHLGRELLAQGHEVRLMAPESVRPYVKAQKNDDRDAEAIAEAATWPTMRFVPVKSAAQSRQRVLDGRSPRRGRGRAPAGQSRPRQLSLSPTRPVLPCQGQNRGSARDA